MQEIAFVASYISGGAICEGDGVVRAYDALAKACARADLAAPDRITSTSLRKYMATMTQVLDLKEHELQWVVNHLGHTLDVHKIHYRCTSDILERTQIAKILILQDQGCIADFQNKRLDEIQLNDIVLSGDHKEVDNQQDVDPQYVQQVQTASDDDDNSTNPDTYTEMLFEAENFFEEEDSRSTDFKLRKKPKNFNKIPWSTEEEEEIHVLFKQYFDSKTRPKPTACTKAIAKSKNNAGLIHRRKKDVLKKKVFRMIDKLQ